MSAQPYGVPSCWSRQFEENDVECDACSHRSSCKQNYLRSRGIGTVPPPPPPPGGWNQQGGQRIHMPVIQPNQGYTAPPPMPAQQPGPAAPQQGDPQMFWNSHHAPYFTPDEGESVAARLGKNTTLAMSASFFETMASFFRTWRWPKSDK